MLEPEGARPAVVRMRAINSRGTGFLRKARVDLRPRIASSTVMERSPVLLLASFIVLSLLRSIPDLLWK
jgi:hypothetical protein